MKSAAATHVGMVRHDNQDNFINYKTKSGVYVLGVADGMGGHNAGDVASTYVVEELSGYFSLWDVEAKFFRNPDVVTEYIKSVNENMADMSSKSPAYANMGTTLTMAVTNGIDCVIFHVGDSRAYILKNSKLKQLTKDHSLVQFMVDNGQITPEQAKVHPSKNVITRAIGTEPALEVDVYKTKLTEGDRLIICSDGLTNTVSEEEITEICLKYKTPSKAVNTLIDEANKNGGGDNVTVVLFES